MMKRLLGLGLSFVLVGSVFCADEAGTENVGTERENAIVAHDAQEIMPDGCIESSPVYVQYIQLQKCFPSDNATVCATLDITKSGDININAVLQACVEVFAAAIDPAYAAQTYLVINKQMIDGVCLSVPDIFANADPANPGAVMAQVMQKMFEALGDRQLEMSVLFYAMGKDVATAVQQAVQVCIQTQMNEMQKQLAGIKQLANAEQSSATEMVEKIKAQVIVMVQAYLNGLVPALADCLEQNGFEINREALGIAESKIAAE